MNRNERLIARVLIQQAAAAGWKLFSVHDGDDETNTDDADKAIELGCNLDECHFVFTNGKRGQHYDHATVQLIFGNGNDGLDVISDYTTNLEEPMKAVNAFVEQLSLQFKGAGLYGPQSKFAEVNTLDKMELSAPALMAAARAALALADALIHGKPEDAYKLACQIRDDVAAKALLQVLA